MKNSNVKNKFISAAAACLLISLTACAGAAKNDNTVPQTGEDTLGGRQESISEEQESIPEEQENSSEQQSETASGNEAKRQSPVPGGGRKAAAGFMEEEIQTRWQMYVQPDMPDAFAEVFEQYEQFMNAHVEDMNDEDVRKKLDGGEWEYVFDELAGAWNGRVIREGASGGDVIRYSLTDLTGDGFPELIMGYEMGEYGDDPGRVIPEIIYYYSDQDSIRMEYASSYFTMSLYEGGVIEYISGGVDYTVTYCQFQKDTEKWLVIDRFYVETVIDGEDVPGGANYYHETDGDDDSEDELITEAEYKRLTDRYTKKPVEPQWMPLVRLPDGGWRSYESVEDFGEGGEKAQDEMNFMSSGIQSIHMWLFRELSYILYDYSGQIHQNLLSDNWVVERITPIGDDCYNALLHQKSDRIKMDVLLNPDEGKYKVLYCICDNDERTTYNDLSYTSQVYWEPYIYDPASDELEDLIDNPYFLIYESSLHTDLREALFTYLQETDYAERWKVEEIYAYSSLVNYLLVSEDRAVWFCLDIYNKEFTAETFVI